MMNRTGIMLMMAAVPAMVAPAADAPMVSSAQNAAQHRVAIYKELDALLSGPNAAQQAPMLAGQMRMYNTRMKTLRQLCAKVPAAEQKAALDALRASDPKAGAVLDSFPGKVDALIESGCYGNAALLAAMKEFRDSMAPVASGAAPAKADKETKNKKTRKKKK
ncbi:MAG: hypothetical protein MR894_07705 [Akkermansia muciniphila]|nr:hypothetical protein [Akkermansia muciniphila]